MISLGVPSKILTYTGSLCRPCFSAAGGGATGMTHDIQSNVVLTFQMISTCSSCQRVLIHHAYNLRTSLMRPLSRLGPVTESAGPPAGPGPYSSGKQHLIEIEERIEYCIFE
jgi:hypothetical protein